nr:DUF317 domain-containing protein [Streptomyces sp. SID3343]
MDQDHGWARESDTAGGDYLASPCRRVQIAHRPERGLTFSWQISAADRPLGPARWEALFDEGIPDETVHAFLDTLAQDVDDGHDRFLNGATLPGIAYGPLLAAGWEPTVGDRPGVLGDGPRVITAPRDTAQLVHQGHLPDDTRIVRDHRYHWEVRGGDPFWDPTWRAAFAGAVPTHLIAAVTTELADPRPVARTADQLPSQNWTLLRVMPTEWLPAPDVATAAQARTTAAPCPPTAGRPTTTGHHTTRPATLTHRSAQEKPMANPDTVLPGLDHLIARHLGRSVADLCAERETAPSTDARVDHILDRYRAIQDAEEGMAEFREVLVETLAAGDWYFNPETAQATVATAADLLALAVRRHETTEDLWRVVPLTNLHASQGPIPQEPSRAAVARNRTTIPTTMPTTSDSTTPRHPTEEPIAPRPRR